MNWQKIARKEGTSSVVRSNQSEIHPRLEEVLQKHLAVPWMQPMHAPSVAAFAQTAILAGGEISERNLILDSGCGTGESTRSLALEQPDALVIGIDRSQHRLQKTGQKGFPARQGNIIWVRAELETFWRLALEAQWLPEKHYLFYPNPYPKQSQLQKRWHAHPVFPALLALGGALEMRCNWLVYAQEFARSIGIVTGTEAQVEQWQSPIPISAFERKYAASGHRLYRVRVAACDLPGSCSRNPGKAIPA